jgi:hypothetical protein
MYICIEAEILGKEIFFVAFAENKMEVIYI